MRYLVITGNHTSCKTPVEYVQHIVYGDPTVTAVLVGSHFVALLDYEDDDTSARYTDERMGSFPHGSKAFDARHNALHEFGLWVEHWAPSSKKSLAPFGSDPSGFTRV